MDIEKRNRNIIIISVAIIILILSITGICLVTSLLTKNTVKQNKEDLYNKTLYVSATLPNISGKENVSIDEFGKKTNVSEEIKNEKKWMNLDFTDFNIYSMNSKTSVISFKISSVSA